MVLAKMDRARFHADRFTEKWTRFASTSIYTVTTDEERPWTVHLTWTYQPNSLETQAALSELGLIYADLLGNLRATLKESGRASGRLHCLLWSDCRMPVGPVWRATSTQALLALAYRLGASLHPKQDALPCRHLIIDKLMQLLRANPNGSDQSVRYQFNKLLSD